jgi:signal transduction histidine kinase
MTDLRNEKQELTGFLGVAYDLTERKKIENMKSEFISTVSHELRTPLTSIHGALDLLAAGVAGELQPDVRTLLDIANEDCNRLVRLVNDILDAEKIASGNMRFDMAVQPLRPLLDQAIAATQAYAAQYGVSFALEADAGCRVRADADRIIQVMINLLSNAAKYSHFGTIVRVRLTETEGGVRVSVIDRGEGIPDEFHDRIFQRFAQADGSDSRKKSGTGLGLSICKAIIEKHRGHISFRSTPGVGSEFYFELPVVEASREIAA